jgi:hypothetical protein
MWGEARIAGELRLKLGIRVAPRTVGKYLSEGRGPRRTPDRASQRDGASTAEWTLQQFREGYPEITDITTWSMTATGSARRTWTRVWRAWECGCSALRCDPPAQFGDLDEMPVLSSAAKLE